MYNQCISFLYWNCCAHVCGSVKPSLKQLNHTREIQGFAWFTQWRLCPKRRSSSSLRKTKISRDSRSLIVLTMLFLKARKSKFYVVRRCAYIHNKENTDLRLDFLLESTVINYVKYITFSFLTPKKVLDTFTKILLTLNLVLGLPTNLVKLEYKI